MSVYFGQLGRLVELKCPASQQVTVDDDPEFQITAEGRRIGLVSAARGRRTWSNQLSDASTPEQVAAVMAFANREWGPGPFIFVSADAPVTNMLPPSVASCDPAENFSAGISAGLAMPTPDGWAGRSYVGDGTAFMFFGATRTPVLPGVKVTGAAYVLGAGAAARLNWYDANEQPIGTTTSSVVGNDGATVRSWVTAVPPAGAAGVVVSAVKAKQGVWPSLTWTDGLFPRTDGQGCPKSILHGLSRNLILASRDLRGGRYSNLSFTVSEVG